MRTQPVPFVEALRAANARRVQLPTAFYSDLPRMAAAHSFTVSRLANVAQIDNVLDSLNASLASGETFAAWKAQAVKDPSLLSLPRGRLETIYRNHAQQAYAVGRCAQHARSNDVTPYRMHVAILDNRVRSSHAALHKIVRRWDDPFWIGRVAPLDHNCFLPGTTVRADVELALKSFYKGPAVEITTLSGKRLRVTKNHPILTSRGWLPAYRARKGDHAIAERGDVNGAVAAKENNKDSPTRIEQVFDALAPQAFAVIGRSTFNLHGDAFGLQADVQVVGADRELVNGVKVASDQFIKQRQLGTAGDRRAASKPLHFTRPACSAIQVNTGLFQSVLYKPFAAIVSDGYIGAGLATLINIKNLIKRQIKAAVTCALPSGSTLSLNTAKRVFDLSPLDSFSLGSVPPLDALLSKNSINYGARNPVSVGHSFDTFSGMMSEQKPIHQGRLPRVAQRPAAHQNVAFSPCPSFNTALSEQPIEHRLADSGLFHEILDLNPGDVTSDEIISVRHFTFSGHVYDLQTAQGVLFASGIIASNCRCAHVSLSEAQAKAIGITADADLPNDPPAAGFGDWCRTPEAGVDNAVRKARSVLPPVLRDALPEQVPQLDPGAAVVAELGEDRYYSLLASASDRGLTPSGLGLTQYELAAILAYLSDPRKVDELVKVLQDKRAVKRAVAISLSGALTLLGAMDTATDRTQSVQSATSYLPGPLANELLAAPGGVLTIQRFVVLSTSSPSGYPEIAVLKGSEGALIGLGGDGAILARGTRLSLAPATPGADPSATRYAYAQKL